eukprot:7222003-Prymnesium_polylepis.1
MGKGQKQKKTKAQTLSLAEFAAGGAPKVEEVPPEDQAVAKLAEKVASTKLADDSLDVIIVGAGAAGIGCAMMLTKTFGLETSRVLLIERGEAIGETFRRWPAEMRFISPSFNQQGWTTSFDLNSIAYGTSPAYSLHAEHP